MKIKVLNPIWSQGNDKETLDKILYLDSSYWGTQKKYKVSSKTPIPEIKELLREEFVKIQDADKHLSSLKRQFPETTDFTISTWRRKQEHKTRKSIVKKGGLFLTGYLERVIEYCKEQGIEWEVVWDMDGEQFLDFIPPHLEGFTPREDQERLLTNALSKQRGTLVAPTGSGKTLLAAWLFSAFPNHKRLFLCHTKTLVAQAYSDFVSYGFDRKDITIVGDGDKDASGKIVIATRQSFIKLPKEIYYEFDMVIVDETHHVSTLDGEYANILMALPCPVRIGLTATQRENREAVMAVEGLLGPNIDRVTLKEGIEKKILAKPVLRVIPIPQDNEIGQLTYQKAYDKGIVNRKARNRTIMKVAKACVANGESCLLLIDRIEHGERLMEMANLLGVDAQFIQGSTEDEIREDVKASLKDKSVPCVVATQIWNEGVNIPSLDNIFLVGDSKSIHTILQKIGRGLRRTEEKSTVKIWDFFDRSSKYFVDHFGERLSAYCEHKINVVWEDEYTIELLPQFPAASLHPTLI
jgi:superfamily II DNA or RNA helicase